MKLTEQQTKILNFLNNTNEVSITKIAKGINAHYGNVLKSINQLNNLKLLKKEKLENNRVIIKLIKIDN